MDGEGWSWMKRWRGIKMDGDGRRWMGDGWEMNGDGSRWMEMDGCG